MLIKAPSIISGLFFMTTHMSTLRFRLWTQNDVCIVNKYVSSHSFHIILTHISQSLIEITNTTNALRACDHWPGPGSSQHWPVTRSRLVSGPRLPDIWPSPPQLSLLPRQCRHRVNTEHKFLQLTFSRERSTGGQLCTSPRHLVISIESAPGHPHQWSSLSSPPQPRLLTGKMGSITMALSRVLVYGLLVKNIGRFSFYHIYQPLRSAYNGKTKREIEDDPRPEIYLALLRIWPLYHLLIDCIWYYFQWLKISRVRCFSV